MAKIFEVSSEYPETKEILVRGDGTKFKRLNAYKVIEGLWHKMTGKAPEPEPITYLTFQSENSFTLNTYNNLKNWDGTLYYSTNAKTWNEWSGTTILNSVDNKLYLRGTGNTVITGVLSNARWVLTGSSVECLGNIENLLDWGTVLIGNSPVMADYCYQSIFRNWTSLITTPSLPATNLTDSCYASMFYGCSSLTNTPELPATIMTSNCYSSMFYGCSSLTNTPVLPATILAHQCYSTMFYDCTSLITTPVLPATTLATNCYSSMFYGCSSLTKVPKLPAIIMTTSCYSSMFRYCSNIKVSNTQTGIYQYAWRIPTSGTGTTATNWSNSMLYDTGGTFEGTPTINKTYYTEYAPV